MSRLSVLLIWAVWGIVGCERPSPALFRQLPASQTGISFNNRLTESDSLNPLVFEYMYNGGGVGVGDFNNDSLPDLYFTGNQVSSRLYLNKTQAGRIRFEDVTQAAHTGTQVWATGVSVIDINQDGWQDLYVCVAGPDSTSRANLLFVNQSTSKGQVPVFSEMAAAYGLADTGYSTQAVFLDYDHDGDLDAYVLTNALEQFNRNAVRPKRLNGEAASTDRLYRNEGVGTAGHPVFKNVSRQAGILTEGYGLGVVVSDFNGDGWEDIYCANDFLSNDLLWINNQNGTFSNQAAAYLKHQTHNAMGVDVADVNNDALPDLLVVDMLPETNLRQKLMLAGSNHDRFRLDLQNGYQPQYMRNTLQLAVNTPETEAPNKRQFSEIGQLAGIYKTDWSWAPLLADFDHDGYQDLIVTNGYRRDVTNLDFITYMSESASFGTPQARLNKLLELLYQLPEVKLPNHVFRNRGDLTFENKTQDWGMNAPSFSNGAAYADLDQDGDLDVVVNNIDDEAFVYENTLNHSLIKESDPHFLQIALESVAPNRAAWGSKVHVYAQGQVQFRELQPVRGFVSSVEPLLHFGLGTHRRVDSVTVQWPDGTYQVMRQLTTNQTLRIRYQPSSSKAPVRMPLPRLFEPANPQQIGLTYQHQEQYFNDFNRTPLLPHQFSQEGPRIAVGDVNADGLDDCYLGADLGQHGVLFIQRTDGHFVAQPLVGSEAYEDTGCTFFDADHDGDLDLYVVSGGSQQEGTSPQYQDRLYRNDGIGRFVHDPLALPSMQESGACIAAADYDHDGDLDLFRGSRLVPGKYPFSPKSFLLTNQSKGGQIRFEATPLEVGLVTAAVWADTNGDLWPELVAAGEWMPLTIWANVAGKLQLDNPQHLPDSEGWWQSLAVGDIDQDGDLDLLAGNLGLNTKYRASPAQPLGLMAADFDQNGKIDPVMTQYLQGEHVVVHTRDLMNAQMVGMKRRFTSYKAFAETSVENAFTDAERQLATYWQAKELRSCWVENLGKGQFKLRALPHQAQLAPVYGILLQDFDQNGRLDALLVGNSYAPETIGGWYDASLGVVLHGTSKHLFKASSHSGLIADLDAKAVACLRGPRGQQWLVVVNNNAPLQLYRVAKHTKL